MCTHAKNSAQQAAQVKILHIHELVLGNSATNFNLSLQMVRIRQSPEFRSTFFASAAGCRMLSTKFELKLRRYSGLVFHPQFTRKMLRREQNHPKRLRVSHQIVTLDRDDEKPRVEEP